MVGPKKQAFCPRINMLKGNFDTDLFELFMILSSWSTKIDYLDFPCEIFEILCELDDGVISCKF